MHLPIIKGQTRSSGVNMGPVPLLGPVASYTMVLASVSHSLVRLLRLFDFASRIARPP